MAGTIVAENRVRRCDDLDELLLEAKSILNNNEPWKEYFANALTRGGYNVSKFSKAIGVSYNTVRKWYEGTLPKSRDNFIKIGLGLHFSLGDTNKMLQRYGKFSALYPKYWKDAICIYTLMNYREDGSRNLIKKYDELCLKYELLINNSGNPDFLGIEGTEAVQYELSRANNDDKFNAFMNKHVHVFANSYDNLLKFIDDYIEASDEKLEVQLIESGQEDAAKDYLRDQNLVKQSGYKRNKRFKNICDSMLSQLRKHRMLPTRKNLIILGIYLNMGLEEMNMLLDKAHMEPLCPKDTVECFLIYALMSIDVYKPEYMLEHAVKLQNKGDKEWKRYCEEFLRYYETLYSRDEYDKKLQDIEETVADVVSNILTDICSKRPEYEEYIDEYIEYLSPDTIESESI